MQFWGILRLPLYYDCIDKYHSNSLLHYSKLHDFIEKEVFFVRKRVVYICLQKSRFRVHFVSVLKIVFDVNLFTSH